MPTETWVARKCWVHLNIYWLHRRYSILPVSYCVAYYWYCCVCDRNESNVFRIVRRPVEIDFRQNGYSVTLRLIHTYAQTRCSKTCTYQQGTHGVWYTTYCNYSHTAAIHTHTHTRHTTLTIEWMQTSSVEQSSLIYHWIRTHRLKVFFCSVEVTNSSNDIEQ